MKAILNLLLLTSLLLTSCSRKEVNETADATQPGQEKRRVLFLDVHNLEPGKVTFNDVAGAHEKDLATQGKYDVNFIKYWVDEAQGKVYCLAEAPDSASVYLTHKEAHGLVPDLVGKVSDGIEAAIGNKDALYLDIHELGSGKVTAADVAGAHEKDLAVQDKYDVNFINYWVDEKSGTVVCLSEAKDEQAVIDTHTEAHGLVPQHVHKVKQGE
jgi:hypothetical protein